MIGLHMGQDENDDLVIAPTAGEVAAFASDLPEHHYSSQYTPHLIQLGQVRNAEVVDESAVTRTLSFAAGGGRTLDVRNINGFIHVEATADSAVQ